MAVLQSQEEMTAEVVSPVVTLRLAVMNLVKTISDPYFPNIDSFLHFSLLVVLSDRLFQQSSDEDHTAGDQKTQDDHQAVSRHLGKRRLDGLDNRFSRHVEFGNGCETSR
jgi:hypothetical protein